MPDAVIADTSPIFYLHRVGCLGILESLYGGILIPGAVAIELDAGRRAGEDVPVIEQFSWISTKIPVLPGWSLLVPDLGYGEAEVIALGREVKGALLIIDDALGRRIAKLNGLKVTGTAGVLLRAKNKGILAEVKPILERMRESGFFLGDRLTSEILEMAGER